MEKLTGRDLIARINELEHQLKRIELFEEELKANPFVIICKRKSRQADFYDQMENPAEFRGRAQTFDVPDEINATKLVEDASRALKLRKETELQNLIKSIS